MAEDRTEKKCLIDAVWNGMSGGVDNSGKGSITDESSVERAGKTRVCDGAGKTGVGKGAGNSRVAEGAGYVRNGQRTVMDEGGWVGDGRDDTKWSGGSGSVSNGDQVTTSAEVSEVSGTGGNNLGSVNDGSGSNGESVAVHTVTEGISDVVSAENLAVRGDVAEGSDLVTMSIL